MLWQVYEKTKENENVFRKAFILPTPMTLADVRKQFFQNERFHFLEREGMRINLEEEGSIPLQAITKCNSVGPWRVFVASLGEVLLSFLHFAVLLIDL
jgi:hypothetical protein